MNTTTTSATFATVFVSAAAAALLAFGSTEPAHAQSPGQATGEMRQVPVPVHDHDLYVDLPTRFAFVKVPGGWKFIGQLDPAQMAKLPPGTLTALLQEVPDDAPQYAAGQPSQRGF